MPMSLSLWQHSAEDARWMQLALSLADKAAAQQEVPIGAVVVSNGERLGSGFNQPAASCDPTAHAEVLAMREAASRVGNYRLASCTLYVTLIPCLMCLGAIMHARIGRVVCGAEESRFAPEPQQLVSFLNQSGMAYGGFSLETGCLKAECQSKLSDFFASRRRSRSEVLSGLSDWMTIPNVTKALDELLRSRRILPSCASNEQALITLQSRLDDLAASQNDDELKARLLALKHYLSGGAAKSWSSFRDHESNSFGPRGSDGGRE